jgi:topoisomerase-4 subunit A
MIEKEPVTIVLSEKGWIRAIKGHQTETDSLAFKEGDRLKRAVKAQTTDTLLLFATNGRFYALGADKLPGGRGHGEPFRLMIDIEEAGDAVELFVHTPGRKLIVAGTRGYGFIVAEDEVLAMTRKGKQVLNVPSGEEAALCAPVDGDSVAVIGDNRKSCCSRSPSCRRCSAARVSASALQGRRWRRQGVRQKEGLSGVDAAGRSFVLTELRDWWGTRARPDGCHRGSQVRKIVVVRRETGNQKPDYPRTASGFCVLVSDFCRSDRSQPLEVRRSCGMKRFL